MLAVRRPREVRGAASQETVPLEVVERCRRGDEQAWRQLVEATQRDVYTLCYRILQNRDDAADATQDAYVRAWRGLRSFRGESLFTTWLHRVAVNAAISKHRSRGRIRGYEMEGEDVLRDVASSASVESDADVRFDIEALEREIARLSDTYRLPVLLKDVYGLSIEEVAGHLKISPTATKVRLHRARKRLRDALLDTGAGEAS